MKDIAFKDNTSAVEQLPFPIVLYPGHYGAFFGFKKSMNDSNIFFCSCAKESIENYIKLRLLNGIARYADPNRMFILDKMYFPLTIVESLRKGNMQNDKTIIKYLIFSDKLCHECNKVIPSYRYCHEMYGGAFKQNFGWYINKQSYEWGLDPMFNKFLPDACPEELLYLLNDEDFIKAKKELRESLLAEDHRDFFNLGKIIQKHIRKIRNIVENEVRIKFGHKKVGEAWTSETILYYIIRTLFPNNTILRHYHPDFLEGLELDIFIKELSLAIEYQGIQHYKPIKHWGGKIALQKLQERDKKKKIKCEEKGVRLIYFNYDEELSNNFVQKRIIGDQ